MSGVWAAGFLWALSEQVTSQNATLVQARQACCAPLPGCITNPIRVSQAYIIVLLQTAMSVANLAETDL